MSVNQALYDMIGTILLPSSIKILIRLGSEEYYLRVQENQAVSFIQAFTSHQPKIQTVKISCGIYWTGMYTAKSADHLHLQTQFIQNLAEMIKIVELLRVVAPQYLGHKPST
jgi:hypothetical protein